MPAATSARRGCAGTLPPRPRRRRAGTPPRRAALPGMPSCSAPAVTPPENGYCTMTGTLSSPPPPRRIMAIWLARLAIDRWRRSEAEGADAHPTALIAETAHGPRLAAANDAGLTAGAQPGMMLADARALCPALKVAPSDPAGDL